MNKPDEITVNKETALQNVSNESQLLSTAEIEKLIYVVRDQQVMLDSDLAVLYGVETKYLNRAASRNWERFPEDFRFRLSREEFENLRCQFGTSSLETTYGGRRYLPYAYTEQGISMLSAVLRSKVAVETSVFIIRAFVEMRHFLASNALLFEKINAVELKQLEDQRHNNERFDRIFGYLETKEAPVQKIFYEGQIYDAFSLLAKLIREAESKIVLVDGYVDTSTLDILSKKKPGVGVRLYTKPNTRLTRSDIETFNAQYPSLEVAYTGAFHDRYLLIDDLKGYLIGASLKDVGKRSFAISKMLDDGLIASLQHELNNLD